MKAEEISKKFQNHERRISKLEELYQPKPKIAIPKKQISSKEFILNLKKRPDSEIKMGLAIGYYLEYYKKLQSFSVKDVEGGFRTAKERIPKNLSDVIQENIKKGFMMIAGKKGKKVNLYTLTSSGEKEIKDNFIKVK